MKYANCLADGVFLVLMLALSTFAACGAHHSCGNIPDSGTSDANLVCNGPGAFCQPNCPLSDAAICAPCCGTMTCSPTAVPGGFVCY